MGNAEYVGSQLCERFQSAKMSTAAEKSKPKKSTTKTTKKMEQAHPPSSVMIVKAIEDLKEKKGSSLASIKKYIGELQGGSDKTFGSHKKSSQIGNREENHHSFSRNGRTIQDSKSGE